MVPRPGDIVIVGGRASVQFSGDRAIILRVTTVHGWPTYDGWVWLRGYVLDRRGEAVDRRDIFVQHAGLRPVPVAAPRSTRAARRR
jgi:hypothetical protein